MGGFFFRGLDTSPHYHFVKASGHSATEKKPHAASLQREAPEAPVAPAAPVAPVAPVAPAAPAAPSPCSPCSLKPAAFY